MTSVRDAAYNLVRAYPGGAASLAPRMEKNPTTLNHEVSGTGSAKFGLDDAVLASVLAKDLRILNAFAAELDCLVFAMPEAGTSCNLTDLSKLVAEFSDVLRVLGSGGEPTANRMAELRREWSELMAMGQTVIARYAASVPKAPEAQS